MIYLIDEKHLRQENYFWDIARFEKHSEYLKPIYTKNELDLVKNSIFSDSNNVIMFHDSFFDDPINRHEKNVDLIRQDLLNSSKENKVVLFSGGIYNRHIRNTNSASIPVESLYKNLEFFIDRYKNNDVKLEYLAYGKNYEYERIAKVRLDIWKMLYKKSNSDLIPTNEKFETALSELLRLLSKEDELNRIVKGSLEAGYLKYKINSWIKSFLHD